MLQEKANIKLSVKEMLSEEKPVGVATLKPAALPEDVKKRLTFLAEKNIALEGENKQLREDLRNLDVRFAKLQKEAEAFAKLKEGLLGLLPTPMPGTLPTSNTSVGLQFTTSIVDVPSAEKLITINTESMRGKILAVAKKGKLESWRKLDEIVRAIEEEHWSATSQEVNNALNDLEKQDLIAKKHTDRNYFCLAQGVKFKEAEKS